MPQMAPLSWLTLMILFIAALYLFNSMNYYVLLYKTHSSKMKSLKTKKINWKW